jgi:membrane glycosyltransferase
MNKLAIRPVEQAEIEITDLAPSEPAWSWLPDEAPLAMPRQSLDAGQSAHDVTPVTSPRAMLFRRLALLAGTVALTGLSAIAPFYLYARKGWDPMEMLAFGIFMVLITAISCWFVSGLMGLMVMLRGKDQADLRFAAHPQTPRTRTALLMPLYNEDARASFARLAQIDASLARLGASSAFDIFVLSDSTKEDAAAAELSVFQAFRLAANSKAYYRRRTENVERKAGNLAEWVRRFGAAYETMIVLDADSTMAGETLLRMVDAMERNPGVGLIQTAPVIIKARTVFARVSQYSVRLYGRVAAAGLAYWTGSESSYWGHNAIIRTRAFAACCGLPSLPGRKPFGGHILSHDVVEAALLRRAGWAVHVTAALDGSWEETPPSITDFIRRDHRWFQGNLQHLGLIGAKGLSPMSRLQLAMGCMAYLSSPLWLASLMVGLFIQMFYPVDWSSFFYILNPQFTPFMLASLLSGVLLIGPKFMGAALVISRPAERRAFGGTKAIAKGMAAEIALSAILAPILMVANTKAFIQILAGHDTGWTTQQREADGLAWSDALRAMRWQMVAGVGFAAALCVRPDLATWFAPIVLPLLLAAPIAVWSSRVRSGDALAAKGFLLTPIQDGVSVNPAVLHTPRSPLRAVAGGVLAPAVAPAMVPARAPEL